MKSKIKIIATLGPSTLKKNFLSSQAKKIDLVRLNMSHLNPKQLEKYIIFLKKLKIKNICIDTEGAQIRTGNLKRSYFLKKNKKISFSSQLNNKGVFSLYPRFDLKFIKPGTLVYVGFDGLILKVLSAKNNILKTIVVSSGMMEGNKGVHFQNYFKIPPFTQKDLKAIEIGKKYKIKHYALSFANNERDVKKFRSLLPMNSQLISKIETKEGFVNRKKIIRSSDKVLIDRGDLSRYIKISKIPMAQKIIIQDAIKLKKDVYIATNLLETMLIKSEPTRAESNDIFSSLESGCSGLVLAAETAIGKYPTECLNFLRDCINNYQNKKNLIKNEKKFFI